MEHPLRSFRKRAKITLDVLAELTGISKATLSRIETGNQNPSLEVIRTLITFSRDRDEIALTAEDFVHFERESGAHNLTASPEAAAE